MRVKRVIVMSVLLVFVLAGLAWLGSGCAANMAMKPWSEQSPKDRLTWMLGIYNAQDRDYRAMADMPNLTPGQKSVLKNKKAIMVKVYPLIDAYQLTVEGGGVPNQQTEQAILNLLNQLQSVGG